MGTNFSKNFYREKALKDYKCWYGWAPYFRYGANTVTGWRRSQEDRISCRPGFYKDLSFFGVFDGHGGAEVSEYLKENLHDHVMQAIEANKDIETSLYLSFLQCDFSLKNLTEEEFLPIKEAVETYFEVEDASSLSKQNEFKSAVSTEISKFFQEKSYKGESSKSSANIYAKSLIAGSSTMQKLFLAPLKDDNEDEEDEDYNVEQDMDTDESVSSIESSPEHSVIDENFEGDGSEMITMESSEPENEFKVSVDVFGANGSEAMAVDNSESLEELKVSTEDSKQDDTKQLDEKIMGSENGSSASNVNLFAKEDGTFSNSAKKSGEEVEMCETSNSENANLDNTEPLVGLSTGSTAVVLVLSKEKAYVANVGDSRCVACINGEAVDLSKDHVPTDPEERDRIESSGHVIKEDRIDGGLNMSRAFGDFGLKNSCAQDPVDAVICHPYISTLDVTDELQFIILASDGIWHEFSTSQEVVDLIKLRENEDPHDICAELFELLMPLSDVTDDGSGCDNMSAVIIFFEKSHLKSYIERSENIKYSYVYPKEEEIGDSGASADVIEAEEGNMKKKKVALSCEENAGGSRAPDPFEKLMFSLADKTDYTSQNPCQIPCQTPCTTEGKVIIEIDLTVSSEDESPLSPPNEGEKDQFRALPPAEGQADEFPSSPPVEYISLPLGKECEAKDSAEVGEFPAPQPTESAKECEGDESVAYQNSNEEIDESAVAQSKEQEEIDESAVAQSKEQETVDE